MRLGNKEETKTIAVKCAKRGNDVYAWRVRKRLSWLKGYRGNLWSRKDKVPKAKVLFFTLTIDPKRLSLMEAWSQIDVYFQKWLRGLRNRYGPIEYIRTWEAQRNGYPHIHGILFFRNYAFETWLQRRKEDGQLVWRISEKPEFEDFPGFVDIRAVQSLDQVSRYIEKRILRGSEKGSEEDGLGNLTLALLWVYRKRSFALSKNLEAFVSDLIGNLHNLTEPAQRTIEGGVLEVTWICLGVFTLQELGIKPEKDPPWSLVISQDRLREVLRSRESSDSLVDS
jgi:hypothetical protein